MPSFIQQALTLYTSTFFEKDEQDWIEITWNNSLNKNTEDESFPIIEAFRISRDILDTFSRTLFILLSKSILAGEYISESNIHFLHRIKFCNFDHHFDRLSCSLC